jgi:glycosyltransferase involved in cell wall biosynthesis
VLPNFTDPPGGVPLGFGDRRGAVFAGRLTEAKGVSDVLELARCLPDCAVTVVGDGPLAATVRGAEKELANLEYRGTVDRRDVGELLASARLLLMPSRWQEPAGLSALEAMAAGTPVIAYEVGGLAEYVRDAGGGVTVETRPQALIEACRRLIADEGEWSRCSQRGIAAAKKTHSPQRYLTEIEDVYRAAREGPARP